MQRGIRAGAMNQMSIPANSKPTECTAARQLLNFVFIAACNIDSYSCDMPLARFLNAFDEQIDDGVSVFQADPKGRCDLS